MDASKSILHKLIQTTIICLLFALIFTACKSKPEPSLTNVNVLNFLGSPDSIHDRDMLVYSDQGAWFGYSLPEADKFSPGFCGPFLMTQDNGVWSSPTLSRFHLYNGEGEMIIDLENAQIIEEAHPAYLLQIIEDVDLRIEQKLVFISPSTAVIRTRVKNKSVINQEFIPSYLGKIFVNGLKFEQEDGDLLLTSERSEAVGMIQFPMPNYKSKITDSTYIIEYPKYTVKPGFEAEFMVSHSFIWPYQDYVKEMRLIHEASEHSDLIFNTHIKSRNEEIEKLHQSIKTEFDEPIYKLLLSKAALTLQNNWRSPAGELRFAGLFPSYHYEWFHGFWAWDSWKHATALAKYKPDLAMSQVMAMYDFMEDDGFIPDCVYRDTLIEKHNYRNTKPPLSAWAIWSIYEENGKRDFLLEVYDHLIKQHEWWYEYRDHDQDGICEYGSTDGTLIAAKWESGMDNAIRFDESQMVKNKDGAWSLKQESVDLNAYLYAEKIYISKIAEAVQQMNASENYKLAAEKLRLQINEQFWDEKDGWYYDTDLDGNFIRVMGPEAWIPLWAEVADSTQAMHVRNHLMDERKFNTEVPFPTVAADHPKFKPYRGYWRGPVWLDQAYFGVKGLRNYGFNTEANLMTLKLIHNAKGVLEPGVSIRENYHPLNGQGLESENFSWTAASYILLLTDEK